MEEISNGIIVDPGGPGTSPLSSKQSVLNDLIALRATVHDKEDGKKLDEAIDHLQKSLATSLWVDPLHVDPKHGDKVFNEEKDAVNKLIELLRDKKSTIPDSTLLGFINRLVQADRAFATTCSTTIP